MSVPPKLTISPDGRLRGSAQITWNDQFPWNYPWPTRNGTAGAFGTAYGGVIHTEDGFEPGTIKWFNEGIAESSAFFSIGMDGHIHQYGPLGKNWMAWTQAAGNPNWRGVEHEDKGDPSTPMTQVQLVASAQVFEAMSTFDGSLGNPWPLEATDDPVNGRGIIFHGDGGVPWGDHPDCPGQVREAQRPAIIKLAKQIRAGSTGPAYITADGTSTLAQLAAQHHTEPSAMLRATAEAGPHGHFPQDVADFVDQAAGPAVPPAGTRLVVP